MTAHNVLVTYSSKHGATSEIAGAIAETLRRSGCAVKIQPAVTVQDIEPYDAVLVGSSLYMGHWQKDAADLLHQQEALLKQRAVWLFDSGPLDHSAEATPGQLPPRIAESADRIGVRGHQTFGGRLERGTPGFVEHLMTRSDERIGDFRDFDQIREWAENIAREIAALPSATPAPASPA